MFDCVFQCCLYKRIDSKLVTIPLYNITNAKLLICLEISFLLKLVERKVCNVLLYLKVFNYTLQLTKQSCIIKFRFCDPLVSMAKRD